jgi:hypothetical protein
MPPVQSRLLVAVAASAAVAAMAIAMAALKKWSGLLVMFLKVKIPLQI